jgi:hypothetical protein
MQSTLFGDTLDLDGRVPMISPSLEKKLQHTHELHSDTSGEGFGTLGQAKDGSTYFLYGDWAVMLSISPELHSNDLELLATLMMIHFLLSSVLPEATCVEIDSDNL